MHALILNLARDAIRDGLNQTSSIDTSTLLHTYPELS